MQQAKSAGRDCLRFFALSEAQRRGYRASMGIGEEVQLGLKENRIVLAQQPVVAATTHAVRYHECLVRMVGRDGKVVTAAQFVPAIEQPGLLRSIDKRVRAPPLRRPGRPCRAALANPKSRLT